MTLPLIRDRKTREKWINEFSITTDFKKCGMDLTSDLDNVIIDIAIVANFGEKEDGLRLLRELYVLADWQIKLHDPDFGIQLTMILDKINEHKDSKDFIILMDIVSLLVMGSSICKSGHKFYMNTVVET